MCIGTSLNMEIEKVIITNAPSGFVTVVLDEIYNVKGRLSLLGDNLLKKIKHIVYIQGTLDKEKILGVQHSFVQHSSLTMSNSICEYMYDKCGPLILIDEYKESFDFINVSYSIKPDFLSNIITKSSDLVYRSHPARRNQIIHDYQDVKISGAIGYSTNYLIEMLKNKIPTYTCAQFRVECILNKNSKRSSETYNIGGLKFNKLSIDF